MLVIVLACASTAPAESPFEPVRVTPAQPPEATREFEEEPVFTLSSEQMSEGTLAPAVAAGVDTEAVVGLEAAGAPAEPEPASVASSTPAPVGLPPAAQFPVRLVSTLPGAQPPRAVLGLPSGQEVVVTPGSILAEQGLIVMTVGAGRASLAKVSNAGDHANVETVELTAQYP
jgi:hypothetical protein